MLKSKIIPVLLLLFSSCGNNTPKQSPTPETAVKVQPTIPAAVGVKWDRFKETYKITIDERDYSLSIRDNIYLDISGDSIFETHELTVEKKTSESLTLAYHRLVYDKYNTSQINDSQEFGTIYYQEQDPWHGYAFFWKRPEEETKYKLTTKSNPYNSWLQEVRTNMLGVPILSPSSYRIWDEEDLTNPAIYLTEDWFELYKENNRFFLGKASFYFDDDFNDCVGMPIKMVVPKRDAILYIDKSDLTLGEVDFLTDTIPTLWPGTHFSFYYNNIQYHLIAEGDFQVETPIHYESEAYTLILSSAYAPTGKLLEKTSMIFLSHDC